MTDTTRSTDHDMREALRLALRDWDHATPVQRTEAAHQAMLLAEQAARAVAAYTLGTPADLDEAMNDLAKLLAASGDGTGKCSRCRGMQTIGDTICPACGGTGHD